MRYKYFCKYILFFRIARGAVRKQCNFTSCKCFFFIAKENILWHKGGLSDNTDSLENLQDRLALITYPIPYNGYSFSLFCPHSLTVLLIFMNMQ